MKKGESMGKLKKFIITLIFIIGIALLFQINNTYAKTGYITNNKLTYVTIENGETLISGFEIGEKVSDVLKNFSEEYSLKIKDNQGKDITNETETKIGTGYKIEIYNEEVLEKTFIIVVYGDTNEDGETGAVDALAIIKNKLEVTMFENKATEEAGKTNVETRNNDEVPKADDALLVIKHKLYDEEYPIEQRIIKTTSEDYNAPTISNIQTNVNGLKITVTATIIDTASLNAEAGISGIKSIEYSIDGENYQEEDEFTVNEAGNYTIYIKAVDYSDNETIITTTVNVMVEQEIAQIGATKYPSIQSAINSITDPSIQTTIKILESIEITSNLNNSKNIILDLDGNTITTNSYYIKNSGTLEIANGTINSSGSYSILNENVLTLQNNTKIENTEGCTIWNSSSNSNLTINGATVQNSSSTLENYRTIINEGTLTINSGEIISSNSLGCISNKTGSKAYIYGGKINGLNAKNGTIYNEENSTIVIGKEDQEIIIIGKTDGGNPTLYNKGGEITIVNGTIEGYNTNTIKQEDGTLNINGGTITNESEDHPTIWIEKGTMQMTDGTITNSGGGHTIHNENGTVTKTGGTAENTYGVTE